MNKSNAVEFDVEGGVSIQEKIDKLKAMVEWFSGEDFLIEQATEKYSQAVELAREIEKELLELKNEIEEMDFTG